MKEVKRVFMVDGKPFYPLGGQSGNSCGYNERESEIAFKAIKLLHGNTLEIPVYWEQIEPKEGKFDFTSINALLASARRYDVKLILLWFATWKNGIMDYCPAWVKTNPQRFKRVISPSGKDIWTLSSHCQENCESDKKAFKALCKYLKTNDGTEHIVIGLQIENEPGIIGSDRDYSPEAQATFDSPVPTKLIAVMKKARRGEVYDLWQLTSGKESGTWPELFGWEAGEVMTAWSIANYIDSIAESGKVALNIPMYINVWLMENPWWPIPGECYPSGSAIHKVLDIYKWFTPHVDMIAPDTHVGDSRGYEAVCATYARDDNPFFNPETGGAGNSHAWNMFRAMADYNCIGDCFFGVEPIIAEDGSVRPEWQMVVDSVRCAAAAIPLLLKYQGTSKIHAVIQEDLLWFQRLDLDGYMGLVEFGEGKVQNVGKDLRHSVGGIRIEHTDNNRGRGLVFQVSRNEFYLVGTNYRLFLRRKPSLEHMKASLQVADWIPKHPGYFVSVDEGHFDQNGEFVADRRRNGDEIKRGVWVYPDVGVVRVITCD